MADSTETRQPDQDHPHQAADVPAMLAGLCRTANLVRRHLENAVLREAELTWNSYDVLQLSVARNDLDTRTTAQVTGLSKPTITVIATSLERRHLIRRTFVQEDNRRVLLHPTTGAWQLVHELHPRLISALTDLTNGTVTGVDAGIAGLLRRLTAT
jgi:DNA-binding MarR family transcriptional regulator